MINCKICNLEFKAKGKQFCCSKPCSKENTKRYNRLTQIKRTRTNQDRAKERVIGKRSYTKDPNRFRNNRMLSVFGISFEQFKQMEKEQNGACAICKMPEIKKYKGVVTLLAIDHCHSTGKVRGLLCSQCNTGIGLLKDSIETLQSAIEYLKESKNET